MAAVGVAESLAKLVADEMAARSKKGETLGLRLARIRKERGMTQVELAERLDLLQPNISDYERDVYRPNADVVVRIAEALDVSTDELLGTGKGKTKSTESTGLSRRFLRRLQKVTTLPKRDQDALLRTIDAFLAARKSS